MAVISLRLFTTVPWVGLQCVIVAYSGHTHLHFAIVLRFHRLMEMVCISKAKTVYRIAKTLCHHVSNETFVRLYN